MSDYSTIIVENHDGVTTVTLNRPEAMNAFTLQMVYEFRDLWQQLRTDDDTRVIVLRAAGERAFSTGLDVKEGWLDPRDVWTNFDPGVHLGPKRNDVWKPTVLAIHGMFAGGAFYWLNESDIVICSPDAQFFDPHVTYGLVAACEPAGLLRRLPLGEVLRISLLGLDERVSAERMYQLGLVSEIVDRDALWARAHEHALSIARRPPAAIQGTVKAIWQTMDRGRIDGLEAAFLYTQIGNPIGRTQVDRATAKPASYHVR
jgi:enoyl-CoA hydratase/carnithine racemase